MNETINYLIVNSENEPDKNKMIASELARHILRTRLDWRPQDIPLLFTFITDNRRQFGNKIMLSHLIEAVDSYEDARIDAREQFHKKRNKENYEPFASDVRNNPDFIEIMSRLSPKREITVPVNAELSPEQIALKNFDELFYKQGQVQNGIRFVFINGIFYNQENYLNLHLQNNEHEL